MSIDHVILGVTFGGASGPVLNCGQRNNPHLNDQKFSVICPHEDFEKLSQLVGHQIWGNASVVKIGDRTIAQRRGYSELILGPWAEVALAIAIEAERLRDSKP